MIPELDDYDWREAFGYAGKEEGTCADYHSVGDPRVVEAIPGVGIDVSPFSRDDVAQIYFRSLGENDERDWVIAGRLNDGRFFGLRAGCDYTGWDCRAWGQARIARSYDEMVWFALEPEERERFGLPRHKEDVGLQEPTE